MEKTLWVPQIDIYTKLRGLSRERELKIEKRTKRKNQLAEIEKEMRLIVESNQELKEKVKKLETVKGEGITAKATEQKG